MFLVKKMSSCAFKIDIIFFSYDIVRDRIKNQRSCWFLLNLSDYPVENGFSLRFRFGLGRLKIYAPSLLISIGEHIAELSFLRSKKFLNAETYPTVLPSLLEFFVIWVWRNWKTVF